ncbi:HvfC family RiPP maturation protein [Pseudoalteromonas sp. T1lg48]|uniref:HvfC family RiPP maturation protein n=1 Tax=Pseudoalteromonas sp. T1lg48 TaxID=2077100 RepID=UPI000CF6493D|nr:putative DNA-binding domain-containing protein [Pseudoalteromonas sp. T1lg48]
MQFQQVQKQFSDYIRDPETHAKPGDIEERRMKIYRELFFNNVNGFLESAFPVLHSLYESQKWQQLVRTFFACHQAHSPYFIDISKEFLHFLAEEYTPLDSDPKFLLELAHYEWIELAVATAKVQGDYRAITAVSDEPMYFSESAQVVCYHYPVQTISITNQPHEPDEVPSYICVYRDGDDEVQFLALNAMTALLLDILNKHPGITLKTLCALLQQQAPSFSEAQLHAGAQQILADLAQRSIVLTLDC